MIPCYAYICTFFNMVHVLQYLIHGPHFSNPHTIYEHSSITRFLRHTSRSTSATSLRADPDRTVYSNKDIYVYKCRREDILLVI